jgi:hypothetical protein
MARNGKIARLPLHIRNELNRRLCEGEPGVKLVDWLNGEVTVWLGNDFEGRPIRITEQNLSEWRQGGYQDWLRHEEAREFMQDLAEQAGELDKAADGKSISDRFGALLAVDMARLAKKFLDTETDAEKRWERLKEISKELSRLRRDEHRAVWTWIKRQKWERQRDREDYEEDEAIRKEVRREEVAPLWAAAQVKSMAAMFGGGPGAMHTAALILEAQRDLEPGCLTSCLPAESEPDGPPRRKTKVKRKKEKVSVGAAKPVSSKTRKSEPQGGGQSIQPNQSKSDPPSQGYGAASQIRPNPTKSNQNCVEAGVTIKVEGTGFKIEGSKLDEGPPHQNMPPLNGS